MSGDMAAASAAVSIGNYKGVMLCNRPFNGVSTTLAKESRSSSNIASSTSKAAFLAGIPTEPLGMNVAIHAELPHAVNRDKKHTALSKHKKWLNDLQKERARLQEELEADEEKQQQRHERFSQREAKFREAVRSNGPETDGDDKADDKAAGSKSKKLRGRPMWALTKETADEKLELMEDQEADDLIDFANNLDLDQFMDDVEIKARVVQVEQQLAQLQSIVDHEEAEEKRVEREQQRLDDKSSGAGGPMNGNDLLRWKNGTSGDGDDDDDARSVASTVLSECKSIRSVHSVRSVAALTKRVEAKLLSGCDGTASESSVVNPRVVTIDEEQGARMQIKTLASNLPYLHRNPGI